MRDARGPARVAQVRPGELLLTQLGKQELGSDRKKTQRLHPKYVLQILTEFLKLNKTLPNVQQASTAISQTVTVVGDMHGQLRDLAEIFTKNGNHSAVNPYIFNGDLVDRGDQSFEVAILLFGFAVADPLSVKINRGNHEDYAICEEYGFIEELFAKYGHTKHASTIADLFAEVPVCRLRP